MKTVNELINELQNLREDFKNLPIVVTAPNKEQFEAKIKLGLRDPFNFEDIKNIVITYQNIN